VADGLAAEQIVNMTTLNDELSGILDSVAEEVWVREPAADEWSAAEFVGHMIEIERHWAWQAARLVASPGVEVARESDDPWRLAGPEAGTVISPKAAKAKLAQAGDEAAEIIRSIPDLAWVITGTQRGRTVTVGHLVQHNLVGHVRQHLDEVRSTSSIA
jgi:DinB superfamily